MTAELLEVHSGSDRQRSGKRENGGCDRRPLGMVTARHAALRPGAHVVAAVHGVLGKGRRLRVMMTVNRAFAFRTYSKRPSREPRMLRQGARTLERPRLNSPSQGANAAVYVTWTSWIVHAGTLKQLGGSILKTASADPDRAEPRP